MFRQWHSKKRLERENKREAALEERRKKVTGAAAAAAAVDGLVLVAARGLWVMCLPCSCWPISLRQPDLSSLTSGAVLLPLGGHRLPLMSVTLCSK